MVRLASASVAVRYGPRRGFGWRAKLLVVWRKAPSLAIGAAVLVFIGIVSLFAPFLTTYDPIALDLSNVLSPPTSAHLFGTDDLGRDVLTRLLYGGRISLLVGIGTVLLALVVGTLLGLPSGYLGGRVDDAIMRLMDALLAMPTLLLAAGIAAALGPKLENVVIAVGVVYVPAFARLVRAQVLAIRSEEYLTAARVVGGTQLRVLRVHVLPNVMTAVVVLGSLRASSAILAEASLSFLGLGAQPPTPTWGSMLNGGHRYLENAPWIALAPGAAIFITILATSALGEGVRQALDPRFRSETGLGR